MTPTAIRRPSRRRAPRLPSSGQAQLERLAAADLGVEDREALQGQVRIDRVDVVDPLRPRRRRQAARQDDPDLRRIDAGGLGELDAGSGRGGRSRAPGAQDRAGLDRADRVAADRPVRRPQLDPRQLRRPAGQRLDPELEPGRDRPADERAVARDAVEGRRGSEVGDDDRRAVEPGRREGVDQPIGADLGRPVGPDRDRDGARGGDEEGPLAALGDRRERVGQARDDGAGGDRGDVGEGRVVEAEERVEEVLDLVGRRSRASVVARRVATRTPLRNRPVVTFVFPMSTASSMAG